MILIFLNIIQVGKMGKPMEKYLIKAGREVVVYDIINLSID